MVLNNIKVKISDQEYALKTSADEDYIKKVAQYINDKMKEVETAGVDRNSQLRIAVLAAMNITAELFECKKKKNEVIEKVEAKALAISEFIQDKISDIELSN